MWGLGKLGASIGQLTREVLTEAVDDEEEIEDGAIGHERSSSQQFRSGQFHNEKEQGDDEAVFSNGSLSWKQKYERISNELTELRKKNLEQRVSVLTEKLKMVESEKEKAVHEAVEAVGELAESKKAAESLIQKNTEQKMKLDESEAARAASETSRLEAFREVEIANERAESQVSERKRLENELLETKDRLDECITSVSSGSADFDGSVQFQLIVEENRELRHAKASLGEAHAELTERLSRRVADSKRALEEMQRQRGELDVLRKDQELQQEKCEGLLEENIALQQKLNQVHSEESERIARESAESMNALSDLRRLLTSIPDISYPDGAGILEVAEIVAETIHGLREQNGRVVSKLSEVEERLLRKLESEEAFIEERKVQSKILMDREKEMELLKDYRSSAEASVSKLTKERADLKKEIDRLEADRNQVVHKLKSKESDLDLLNEALNETQKSAGKEVERLRADIARLNGTLASMENQAEDVKISQESSSRHITMQWESLNSQFAGCQAELADAREKFAAQTKDLENLQRVLDQWTEKESREIALKVEDLEDKIAALKKTLARSEHERATLGEARDSAFRELVALRVDNDRMSASMRSTASRCDDVERALQEALSQLRSALSRSENDTVDRHLVVQLFVSYISRSDKRKELLELMSKILSFSDSEKEQVGLTPRKSWFSFRKTEKAQQRTLGDLWIDFLLHESDAERSSAEQRVVEEEHTPQPETRKTDFSKLTALEGDNESKKDAPAD